MAVKNEDRRTTAQASTKHTINRIDSKLRKIPLPLASKDRYFQYERIVDEKVSCYVLVIVLTVERNGGKFGTRFRIDLTT